MHEHDPRSPVMKQLREQLGKDINADILEDLAQHMKECPDCKIYVDTVRQTVELYRVVESPTSVPEEVTERLFKRLHLK
ncbi:MAG: hypothetical protein ACE5DP_01400 [Fidelibacterota bacterium]